MFMKQEPKMFIGHAQAGSNPPEIIFVCRELPDCPGNLCYLLSIPPLPLLRKSVQIYFRNKPFHQHSNFNL